jgi:aminoglycoside phosphotransferase (APT) family kinase protein
LEAYLKHALGMDIRLLQIRELSRSTRDAPWRLDVEVDGAPQAYLLRFGSDELAFEYAALKAMEAIPIPTPRSYGLDERGRVLGTPCFLEDFIDGEPLLKPMQAGETWAEELYIETVCSLQTLTRAELPDIAEQLEDQTAADALERANQVFLENPQPLAETIYRRLKESMPNLPSSRFSNGDLWLENFIVRGKQLAGVIDFENSGFSDPIFEFLLSFFVEPKLCGRGIEERYCRRLGFDPALLHWYHGLEFFETWSWAVRTGKTFVHHSAASLQKNLEEWLSGESKRKP